jgi:hypothetical protein
MKTLHILRAAALVALLGATAHGGAVTKTFQQPADPFPLKPSALAGYAQAQAVCGNCHSAEYMQYQPPTAARPYWDTMVKRMKAVFKAPIADEDIPVIVDYLVKTYGNEQPK